MLKQKAGEIITMDVYYIGGSPGSGKSTIAKMLAKKYGFTHYKLDDYLFEYMKKAAQSGKEHSMLTRTLSQEQTWMREPQVQVDEEFDIYREIFPFALAAIEKMSIKKGIIAEGAGFTPRLIAEQKISPTRYICIVPTDEFQRKVFANRKWIKLFLKGCNDPSAAFENWMRRDSLFAAEALEQAKELGYTHILVDGKDTIAENYNVTIRTFGLT